MTFLTLTPDVQGERLDSFLARSIPDLTRSAAQKLLERGSVTIQDRPAKKNEKTERTAFHRRLSVVKENDELLGIGKLLLGREEKQAAVCDVWFSSKVFIGEERYFLKGTKREGDSLFSVVAYKKGSAVPCDEEYFSAVRQKCQWRSGVRAFWSRA